MMTTKRIEHIELSHILTVFVLLSVCTKQLTAAEPGRCIDDEKRALLDFKSGLVDDYGRLSTWNDTVEEDCCRWSGVSCSNRTGNVVRLNLRGLFDGSGNRPLTGMVNPSLLRLPYLNYLDLSGNNFGLIPIPKFIGSLANLTYLNLSTAYFSGTVPNQLGNLSELRYLSLSYSASDAENLQWLSGLTLLEHLDMDKVDLSKAIDWAGVVSRLPSLSYLSLSTCQLPDPVFPFKHPLPTNYSASIRTLDLSYNNLTSSVFRWLFTNVSENLVSLFLSYNQLVGRVPEAFGNITSLAYLRLSNNQLEGEIPESFRYLSSLSTLDLSTNALHGIIPKSLGSLCNLKNLYLANNRLSGHLGDFIDELSRCPRGTTLEVLDVGFNNLTGAIPDTIGVFSPLKKLILCSNQLNGTLPGSLGTLTKLEYLDISYNSLQGVVSEVHLLNVSHLTYLKMANNRLALKFDPRWVPPFQLEFIYLSSCNLGPGFPRWIHTQENLNIIDISNASIVDTIPARFWDGLNSTYLRSLNLSYNQIKGTVPDLSSRVSDFGIIDLSFNLFEGAVPPFPSTLLSLNLSRNKFSGPISFLCRIVDGFLTFLDLSHNLLAGGLPDCFSNFQQLKVLNLAHNNLSGTVPMSLGSLALLEVLNLYNNSLHGELPLAFKKSTNLTILNLGSNDLSGGVPEWIGENLVRLYVLSLRSNHFLGTIPMSVCQLKDLGILDLSINRLSGKIPKCLNNLTSMVQKERPVQVMDVPYVDVYEVPSYMDNAIVGWQGREVEFQKNLGLLKSIDLSSNDLSGEIPDGITDLFGLIALNLSRNQLNGRVPPDIGRLTSVSVLDLSRNKLSGDIPASMSRLSFLGYLDLSHNNLSGRIPSSTQLQSFDASTYAGNPGLCGPPLTKPCPGDELPTNTTGMDRHTEKEGEDVFWRWFGNGAVSGFAAGFCGVCGALLLNRRWGDAVFVFVIRLKDLIILKAIMLISKVKELIRIKV